MKAEIKIEKTLTLPKNLKSVLKCTTKESPLVLFYRWVGEQIGFDFEDENNDLTFDVSEVYVSEADYSVFKEQTKKWVNRDMKAYNQRAKDANCGMHLLCHAPSTAFEKAEQGKVYLSIKHLTKKRK